MASRLQLSVRCFLGLISAASTAGDCSTESFVHCQTDVIYDRIHRGSQSGGGTSNIPGTGPGAARTTTPAATAIHASAGRACASVPACAKLAGNCCPNDHGMFLGCCTQGGRRVQSTSLPAMIKKGFTIDDTTLQYCPGMIPEEWPNAETPVSSMRLFHAWSSAWEATESRRQEVFRKIADFSTRQGVKLLIGTPVTCSQADDDQNWQWTKELLALLGSNQVMGLAVGNELELLFEKDDVDKACITELWEGGRLLETLKSRVEEFDKMGFKSVPVTVVFTASVLGGSGGNPFMEVKGQALANSFLLAATQLYGSRFAFTINVYPYFDGNLNFDLISTNPLKRSKSNCSDAIDQATCWDRHRCLGPGIMAAARRKITQLTQRLDTTFWVGEIGWSSPRTNTLGTHMAGCDEFSGMAAFERFYRGFLEWDLTLPSGERGPDHAFYFTLRDSLNFGIQEHFGLMNSCSSLGCKIKSSGFQAPDCPSEPQVAACIYMRSRRVQECCAGGSKKVRPRRLAEGSSSGSDSSE